MQERALLDDGREVVDLLTKMAATLDFDKQRRIFRSETYRAFEPDFLPTFMEYLSVLAEGNPPPSTLPVSLLAAVVSELRALLTPLDPATLSPRAAAIALLLEPLLAPDAAGMGRSLITTNLLQRYHGAHPDRAAWDEFLSAVVTYLKQMATVARLRSLEELSVSWRAASRQVQLISQSLHFRQPSSQPAPPGAEGPPASQRQVVSAAFIGFLVDTQPLFGPWDKALRTFPNPSTSRYIPPEIQAPLEQLLASVPSHAFNEDYRQRLLATFDTIDTSAAGDIFDTLGAIDQQTDLRDYLRAYIRESARIRQKTLEQFQRFSLATSAPLIDTPQRTGSSSALRQGPASKLTSFARHIQRFAAQHLRSLGRAPSQEHIAGGRGRIPATPPEPAPATKLTSRTHQVADLPSEIRIFLEDLVEEAGFVHLTLIKEIHDETIIELYKRLDNFMMVVIIEKLPPQYLEEFVVLNEQMRPPANLQAYLMEHVPNAQEVFTEAMLEFRSLYLAGISASRRDK